MKAVILAGSLGSRIVEETSVIPKPMIAIGNKPILWQIMKIFSCHNINEFIVSCGYLAFTDGFEVDPVINGKLLMTSSSGGYLRCLQ